MEHKQAQEQQLLQAPLNEGRFVALLEKLLSESKWLQNGPALGLVPQEDRVVHHVLKALEPFSGANGPLKVEHCVYVEGRGNLIITYPGTTDKTIGLVGSHMDVVPANPESWDRDPFALIADGDMLYGRGTTDCLGHISLITNFMIALAEERPVMEHSIVAVFIAAEEGGEEGVGVDMLVKEGKLAHLKDGGPILWVDVSDATCVIGTGGCLQWTLKATCGGVVTHSALPHRGVNTIELLHEALAVIQARFYQDFPEHELEAAYDYLTPSTMKPTQMRVAATGSAAMLPAWAECSGDVRLTPFYDNQSVVDAIQRYVSDLNSDLSQLDTRGPSSKYELPGGLRGQLSVEWTSTHMKGVAVDINSPAHKALVAAVEVGTGSPAKVGSGTGSLPLVREMKDSGFDLHIIGFGVGKVYHGDNEFCRLSDMVAGFSVLNHFVTTTVMEQSAAAAAAGGNNSVAVERK